MRAQLEILKECEASQETLYSQSSSTSPLVTRICRLPSNLATYIPGDKRATGLCRSMTSGSESTDRARLILCRAEAGRLYPFWPTLKLSGAPINSSSNPEIVVNEQGHAKWRTAGYSELSLCLLTASFGHRPGLFITWNYAFIQMTGAQQQVPQD